MVLKFGCLSAVMVLGFLLVFNYSFAGSTGSYNSTQTLLQRINSGNINDVYTNVTAKALNQAEAYIIQRLGEDYYNSYITNGFNSTYIKYGDRHYYDLNVSVFWFSYNVPFLNRSSAVKFCPSAQYCYYNPLFVELLIADNGTPLVYQGPSKPFYVNISANQAMTIGSQSGFKNGTATWLLPVNNSRNDSLAGYSVAWDVAGYGSGPNFRIIYVDSQTGKVLGEANGFGSPGGTYPGPAVPSVYTTGNFSLFTIYVNNTAGQSIQKTNSADWYLIAVVIIVVILILLVCYLAMHGRK
ncbi:TPA: hypothetical protein HA291_01265 [Candidatus Micrarchaeota archaeon]|jgi:hypothetical protein|nr:hypothetical protein [Candidatus Micrarchaeota archaeon]HII10090.1 hypothetical protein [Candidatus Micrarchaeota archaeon]